MAFASTRFPCLIAGTLIFAIANMTLGNDSPMAFPGHDWEEATPESQGVDPARLDAAITYLRENVGQDGVQRLVIVRNGRMIWKGSDIDHRQGVWSCTKSFTSTVLGLLIDDGKVRLDSPAMDFQPSLAKVYPQVTMRHFATMTSGYRAVGDEPRDGYTHGPSRTPFLPSDRALFVPPGSRYAYWDSAMNQFANVLTTIAGESIEQLFKRRIADPIGMDVAGWDWGDFGQVDGLTVNGGAGNNGKHVQITARQLTRFGHLLLNRGQWNGRQLISREWVDAATSVQVSTATNWGHKASDIDGRGVYGFNWWVNARKPNGERKWPGAPRGTFAASGYNNNKCFVVPEWQMVVVRLGLDGNVDDGVWSGFFALLAKAVDQRKISVEPGFPPPESQGGWPKLNCADEIRQVGGMDPDRLNELRDWLLESDDRDFAAVVIRDGRIVLEVERGNSAKTDSRRVASVSKAICATVLAIAAERSQQGRTPRKMSFDDPAFDFIPQAHPLSDPRKSAITVKQLLNHTSGITPEATSIRNQGPWKHVLGHDGDPHTAKLAFEPGTACGYSTFALYHASLVCENVTGQPYDQFAIASLFQPIGCEHWWFQHFEGGAKGYGRHPSHAMGMPARDLARIAYCMLRDGRWNDRQVIPKWFVDETAQPTHSVRGPEMRFRINAQTFSHGWELPAQLTGDNDTPSGDGIPGDARFKPGSGGQLIAFVPSLDLVVTRQTGGSGAWEYTEYLRRACAAVIRTNNQQSVRRTDSLTVKLRQ